MSQDPAIGYFETGSIQQIQTQSDRRTWPWWIAIIVAIAFILAEHNYDGSLRWRITHAKDVQALAEAVEGGTARRQVGFVMLGAMAVWGAIVHIRRPLKPDLAIAYPVIALVVWSLLSVCWSINLAFTAKRVVVFAILVFAALAIVRHYTMQDLARIAFSVSLAYVIIGVIAELALGTLNIGNPEYRFAGTVHPNLAATNATILVLTSLYLFDTQHLKRYLLVALIGFVALIGTRSRTSLAAAMLGIGIFVVLRWSPRVVIRLFTLVLVLVVLGSLLKQVGLTGNYGDTVLMARKDSDPTTLTGRTQIWEYAFKQVNREPTRFLVGHGFQSFWNTEHAAGVSAYVHFKIAEGHSAYVDSLLNLGAVGLALYVLVIISALIRNFRAGWISSSQEAALAAGIIAFMIIHSIAESASIDPHFPSFICFTVLGFAAFRRFDASEEQVV